MRRILVPAAVVLAALGFATSANASTAVSTVGGTLTITGDGGKNAITVNLCCGDKVQVEDSQAGVTAGDGCRLVDTNRVECTTQQNMVVTLGDSDDTFGYGAGSEAIPNATFDGGAGNDTIISNSFASKDVMNGGPGDDLLNGNGGDDILHGDEGDDTVLGGSGNDKVFGDAGNDVVRGEGNDDEVDGGPGRDALQGDYAAANVLDGSDTINAADGEVDTVGCGFGADTVTADTADSVDETDCETINRAGGGATVSLSAVPKKLPIKTLISKGIRFKVSFASDCDDSLAYLFVPKASARKLKLGKKDFIIAADSAKVPAGGPYAAKLKPKSSVANKIKKLKKIPAVLAVACGPDDLDATKVSLTG